MAKRRRRPTRRTARSVPPPLPVPASAYRLRAEEVERDLVTGRNVKALEEYFGEETYEELQGLARQARRAPPGGERVYILPGIMGSQLGTPDDVIWVDPFDIGNGRLVELALNGTADGIDSLGVIPLAYLMIKLRLRLAGFDADFFDYDWRLSLDELGKRLSERLSADPAPQVSLVAHSMGGLVARAALPRSDDKIRQLIMLGTPNCGSFMPIQAMRGTYALLRRVAAFDRKHTAEDLSRIAVVTWPGLCQMLPFSENFSAVDLFDAAAWPASRPSPAQPILDQARRAQQRLPPPDRRCRLVAGVNRQTVVGIALAQDDFVESLSLAGDGTVPLELARVDNLQTYYVEENHGSLPNNRRVIHAVIDLLETGETDRLEKDWAVPRVAQWQPVRPPSAVAEEVAAREVKDASLGELRHLLQEVAAPPEPVRVPVAAVAPMAGLSQQLNNVVVGRRMQHRLDLRLALGSIAEVDCRAVVLGVFRDVSPGGPAAALDARLDGAIAEFTRRRMFGAAAGEVFVLPTGRYLLRCDNVLLAGMGTFDQFDDSVQQLVAENTIRTFLRTQVEDFATVLVGSASGQEIGRSLENLLKGYIAGLLDADSDHSFRRITLCELDRQRYCAIRQELYRLVATSLFDGIEVTFDEIELPAPVVPATAPRGVVPAVEESVYLIVRLEPYPDRLVERARGRTTRVMVRELPKADRPNVRQASDTMQFRASLLTTGGKATVISDVKQLGTDELDRLLARIEANEFSFDALEAFGRQLAELVLPPSVLEALPQFLNRHLVIVHDAAASRIPWETIRINPFPAAGEGLSRRYLADNLSVAKWLEERRRGEKLAVLLVVNPTGDLPGAEEEGARIRDLFGQNRAIALAEIGGPQATHQRLSAEFSSGKYDVVHYAGHAFFDEQNRSRSGILCADGRVLSGSQLASLSQLPSLVFFNACEAGRVRAARPLKNNELTVEERIDRNVSLAEAYLRGGVANYLGTYWPVGDAPAKSFAETFYRAVLEGQTLGKAVQAGRRAVRDLKSVDWSDYIHYGDHQFALKLP